MEGINNFSYDGFPLYFTKSFLSSFNGFQVILKDFYLFLERGERKEKEGEKYRSIALACI